MISFDFFWRYLIHYVGFDKVFNFLPIKVVWSFFVALFRTHAVCNMVALAADTIKAGKILRFLCEIINANTQHDCGYFREWIVKTTWLRRKLPLDVNVNGTVFLSPQCHVMLWCTGPYYPCALVGPIVIGTAVGSLGQFFPPDKGLSALTNGLPWPIQVRLKCLLSSICCVHTAIL